MRASIPTGVNTHRWRENALTQIQNVWSVEQYAKWLTFEHGGSTGQHDVSVQILSDIDIALRETTKHGPVESEHGSHC
jgi:hypothetical protein